MSLTKWGIRTWILDSPSRPTSAKTSSTFALLPIFLSPRTGGRNAMPGGSTVENLDYHEAGKYSARWEKVLWRKQPFPDNYVPPSFLVELDDLRQSSPSSTPTRSIRATPLMWPSRATPTPTVYADPWRIAGQPASSCHCALPSCILRVAGRCSRSWTGRMGLRGTRTRGVWDQTMGMGRGPDRQDRSL